MAIKVIVDFQYSIQFSVETLLIHDGSEWIVKAETMHKGIRGTGSTPMVAISRFRDAFVNVQPDYGDDDASN